MQDQLTELEIKIAHIEHSLNELSDVLVRQQTYIDKLEHSVERLYERLQSENEIQTDSDPRGEKPPHY